MSEKTLPKPPAAAMPVIRLIRELVPRPRFLPKHIDTDSHNPLRFPCGKCPMGFLPGAEYDTPGAYQYAGLPKRMEMAVLATWGWWDSLRAPTPELQRLAVDLVWGRVRRKQ